MSYKYLPLAILSAVLFACGGPLALENSYQEAIVSVQVGAGARALMDDARIDSVLVSITNSSDIEVGSGSLTKEASYWQGDITVSELGDLTFSAQAKWGVFTYFSGETSQLIAAQGDSVSVGVTENVNLDTASGDDTKFFIDFDGKLYSMGKDNQGQTGLGLFTWSQVDSLTQVGSSTDWDKIYSGANSWTFGIQKDGSLWAWGYNAWGNLGINNKTRQNSPVQVGTAAWLLASPGKTHSLGIQTDNTLWAWGSNSADALGDSSISESITPHQIGIATDWAHVSAGNSSSFAIKSNGSIWSWGSNTYGQLGSGDTTPIDTPTQIGTDLNWESVTSYQWSTFAIKTDGTLWSWGYNQNGELGQGNEGSGTHLSSPTQIGTDSDWKRVVSTGLGALAQKDDGSVYGWGGANLSGQGTNSNVLVPTQIGIDDDWHSIQKDGLMIKSTGEIFDIDGSATNDSPVQVGTGTDWSIIRVGALNYFGIQTDNTLWAWGKNEFGQLGTGSNDPEFTPQQIGSDTWLDITSSGTSLGVKSDGTLWAWGKNQYGSLGQGVAEPDTNSPTQIGSASNWEKTYANGLSGMFAINTDGDLYGWGYNLNGQLGLNHKTSPIENPTLIGTGWKTIIPFFTVTYGIKTDGTLWYFGNLDGTESLVPTQIGTDTDWEYGTGTYGINNRIYLTKTTGEAYTYTISTGAVQQGSLTIWDKIFYSQSGTFGLTNTNNIGELPSTSSLHGTGFTSMDVGYYHFGAIKSDGSLWTWGSYSENQGHGNPFLYSEFPDFTYTTP